MGYIRNISGFFQTDQITLHGVYGPYLLDALKAKQAASVLEDFGATAQTSTKSM